MRKISIYFFFEIWYTPLYITGEHRCRESKLLIIKKYFLFVERNVIVLCIILVPEFPLFEPGRLSLCSCASHMSAASRCRINSNKRTRTYWKMHANRVVQSLKKTAPSEVSRQISQKISTMEENESSFCFSTVCIWLTLACIPILILGIIKVIIGFANIFHCPHSWIPIWLFISGVNIIIIYPIGLFTMIRFCFRRQSGNSEERQTRAVLLVYLQCLFSFIWYILGCYWTWSSLSKIRQVTEEPTSTITQLVGKQFVRASACEGFPLWFSFISTLFPLVYLLLFCGLMSYRMKRICWCITETEVGRRSEVWIIFKVFLWNISFLES